MGGPSPYPLLKEEEMEPQEEMDLLEARISHLGLFPKEVRYYPFERMASVIIGDVEIAYDRYTNKYFFNGKYEPTLESGLKDYGLLSEEQQPRPIDWTYFDKVREEERLWEEYEEREFDKWDATRDEREQEMLEDRWYKLELEQEERQERLNEKGITLRWQIKLMRRSTQKPVVKAISIREWAFKLGTLYPVGTLPPVWGEMLKLLKYLPEGWVGDTTPHENVDHGHWEEQGLSWYFGVGTRYVYGTKYLEWLRYPQKEKPV
jgi:hypothetical protein